VEFHREQETLVIITIVALERGYVGRKVRRFHIIPLELASKRILGFAPGCVLAFESLGELLEKITALSRREVISIGWVFKELASHFGGIGWTGQCHRFTRFLFESMTV
jgi:hypothetical protein